MPDWIQVMLSSFVAVSLYLLLDSTRQTVNELRAIRQVLESTAEEAKNQRERIIAPVYRIHQDVEERLR